MKKISRQEMKNLLKSLVESKYSQTFSVLYKKKDGEIRTIQCRLNVKKYLQGGSLNYDLNEKGCISIADMEAMKRLKAGDREESAYRSLILDNILEAHISHEHLVAEQEVTA